MEALVGLAGLIGWALVTWGLTELIADPWVWKVSVGLLCLGLFGYGTLWQIFRTGLLGQTERGATDGDADDSGPEGGRTGP